MLSLKGGDAEGSELLLRDDASLGTITEILILMKVGISTSTWFQVVPFCPLISEQFLFSLSDDFLRRL